MCLRRALWMKPGGSLCEYEPRCAPLPVCWAHRAVNGDLDHSCWYVCRVKSDFWRKQFLSLLQAAAAASPLSQNDFVFPAVTFSMGTSVPCSWKRNFPPSELWGIFASFTYTCSEKPWQLLRLPRRHSLFIARVALCRGSGAGCSGCYTLVQCLLAVTTLSALLRTGHVGHTLQVLAAGAKGEVSPACRVTCLELDKPEGRCGFTPVYFLLSDSFFHGLTFGASAVFN